IRVALEALHDDGLKRRGDAWTNRAGAFDLAGENFSANHGVVPLEQTYPRERFPKNDGYAINVCSPISLFTLEKLGGQVAELPLDLTLTRNLLTTEGTSHAEIQDFDDAV